MPCHIQSARESRRRSQMWALVYGRVEGVTHEVEPQGVRIHHEDAHHTHPAVPTIWWYILAVNGLNPA